MLSSIAPQVGLAGPAGAAGGGSITVVVLDPQQARVGGGTLTADDLAAAPDVIGKAYSVYDDDGHVFNQFDSLTGLSLDAVLARYHVAPQLVSSVDVLGTGGTQCHLVLASTFNDFGPDPSSEDYPFAAELPPVAAPFGSGLVIVAPIRKPGRGDASVSDGAACQVSQFAGVRVTAQLTNTLLAPAITASTRSLRSGGTASFTATVQDADPSDALTWSWDFGDGHTAVTHSPASAAVTRTSSTPYTFRSAGSWPVTVTVSGSNGSAGVTSQPVTVAVSSTTPTPTPKVTPTSPGPDHGTAGSTAPVDGPVTGTGPRVGGVATGRGGNGRAGASYDPRSPQPSSSGTGTTAAPSGAVVGYLLSDGTAAAAPRNQVGVTPHDDTAPAARDGVDSWRLGGWAVAVGVVVALLVAGAGSERRRPARRRR